MSHTLLLGAHMSIAGGFDKAIGRGESIGCTCIQIFSKSNRQWLAKHISEQDALTFIETVKKSSISPKHIVTHASYLINIGSAQPALHKKSTESLIEELDRCEQLQIPYLVIHPGAMVGDSLEGTLKRIADTLDAIFQDHKGTTKILLETTAGQGSTICYQLEQIAQIYNNNKHKSRLGVCVDTCHIFAAGYDIRTSEGYKDFWHKFDSIIGLNLLYAIHINDSKAKLGSRVDRHADIGKGEIGLPFFQLLFNDKRFFDIPKILETPESSDIMQDYARNMDVIRGLINKENRKLLGMD